MNITFTDAQDERIRKKEHEKMLKLSPELQCVLYHVACQHILETGSGLKDPALQAEWDGFCTSMNEFIRKELANEN